MARSALHRVQGPEDALSRLAHALHEEETDTLADAPVEAILAAVLQEELPFVYHYQPIVDLARGITAGYEALVRFPIQPTIPPDRMLACADHWGCREELEALITREAVHQRGFLPVNTFLSINASPSFVLSSFWDEILAEAGDLRRVVVEITENQAVDNYGPLLQKVAAIREAGGSIAVDDAGSGYSSLKHVMALRPEFVKLDRTFISNCDKDPAKSALIEMVGNTAGRLDAWLIAEGVETERELEELINLEVPLAQGYFLARPQPQMQPLAAAPAHAIVKRVREIQSSRQLRDSVDPCVGALDEPHARAMLAADPALEAVMVVDAWGGPALLLQRHPLAGVRVVAPLLRMQGSTPARTALQRALTRPGSLCFDPIVAIDELGRFTGLVNIDQLTRHLLT